MTRQMHTPTLTAPSSAVRQVERGLRNALDGLLAAIDTGEVRAEQWDIARQALAALPLGTAEFGQSLNRLHNARSYVRHKERGAARFELRLLRRGLDFACERAAVGGK